MNLEFIELMNKFITPEHKEQVDKLILEIGIYSDYLKYITNNPEGLTFVEWKKQNVKWS